MSDERAPYWIGQVYVLDGNCWTTELRLREFVNVCLGKEEDVVPVLKGEKASDSTLSESDLSKLTAC